MCGIRAWIGPSLAVGLLVFAPRAFAQGAPPSCNPASPVPTLCGEWQTIADADWVSNDPGNPTTTLVQAIHMVLTRRGYVVAWAIGTDGGGGYLHYWNPNHAA